MFGHRHPRPVILVLGIGYKKLIHTPSYYLGARLPVFGTAEGIEIVAPGTISQVFGHVCVLSSTVIGSGSLMKTD